MLRAEGNRRKRDATWGHLMEVGASWLTIQALKDLQENKSNPCLVSAPRKGIFEDRLWWWQQNLAAASDTLKE